MGHNIDFQPSRHLDIKKLFLNRYMHILDRVVTVGQNTQKRFERLAHGNRLVSNVADLDCRGGRFFAFFRFDFDIRGDARQMVAETPKCFAAFILGQDQIDEYIIIKFLGPSGYFLCVFFWNHLCIPGHARRVENTVSEQGWIENVWLSHFPPISYHFWSFPSGKYG